MARNKKRKKPQAPLTKAAPSPVAYSNKAVLLVVLAVVLGITYASFRRPSAVPHPPARRTHTTDESPMPVEPDAATDVDRLLREALRNNTAVNDDFEQWFDIAEQVAHDDVQAQRLLTYARAHSVPSILGPQGVTRFIGEHVMERIPRLQIEPSQMTPRAFEITVADMAMRQSVGMVAAADWEYSQYRNELFVPPRDRFSETIGAIILLHELQHVYDVNTGIEPLRPTRDQWAEGEARAYTLEFRLIERYTHGRSRAVAQDWLVRLRPGRSEWILTEDIPHEARGDWEIALSPARTDQERATRMGSLLVLLNRELAEREGTGHNGFLQFLIAEQIRRHSSAAP